MKESERTIVLGKYFTVSRKKTGTSKLRILNQGD